MFILSIIVLLNIILITSSNDISNQVLLNNSIMHIMDIINNGISSDEIKQIHFNNCKNKIITMSFNQLYELYENSGKSHSDIGNFWDCVSKNFSYHIFKFINEKNMFDNKAFLYLDKNYSDYGLCIPKECNDAIYDFTNSNYYKSTYLISNVSIYSYNSSAKINKKDFKKEKMEIISIIIIIIILILLFIKILTPILFGTCLYKYSYLKYTKGNNYISVVDTLTDDEELMDDTYDENLNLFRINKLNEMKKEGESRRKSKKLKSVVFKKHLQSFFSININLDLLISNNNFLYNNDLLQPISFFKSVTLFLLFYNESFYALINFPTKNSTNEHFYDKTPMIILKLSTYFIDVYIALEGFIFAYKLFNYIIKYNNYDYFGFSLLLFYAKTIPKIVTCFCAFFIFRFGLKFIMDYFDLSPFVEYIREKSQKKCELYLSYIFIPFKLQYSLNSSCIPRMYEICYRYMYVNLNIQISITFSLIIIYLVFKLKDKLFDKIILLLFFINSLFSPLSCHHDLKRGFNIYIFGGETCTIKYTHLFINKFFFGMLFGIIYFYHNDIISQSSLSKIYFNDKFVPFSYCRKLMKFLDTISPGLKIIFIIVCILFQILLSSIFLFYERANNNIIFETNRFDWILIENYEKKVFIFFFMFMLLNLLFINKISNSMIYKWQSFNFISRSSFSMFCTMQVLIYFIYSNYYIKIYLNFYNIFFMATSHFIICLFINAIFTILTELSFKIICKNTFGILQNYINIKGVSLESLVKSHDEKQNKSINNNEENYE